MKLTQKPSGIWRVDYIDPKTGARRRESCRTKNKAEANQIAAKLVAGDNPFAKPEAFPVPEKAPVAKLTVETVTMRDLFHHCQKTVWNPERLRSQATLRSNLKVLEPLVGKVLVRDMTKNKLKELSETLFGMGYKAATVKRKMDCVGRAMTTATEWDIDGKPVLVGRPKFPEIKTQADKNQRRNLTEAEEAAMFAAIDKRIEAQPMVDWRRFRMLMQFLLDTGMRLGEALALERKWFSNETGTWFVHIPAHVTKSQKARPVPCTKAVVAMIPALEQQAVGGKLFPYRPATVWQRFNSIRLDVKAAGKEDIDDVVVHSLRHTCLTRLARKHELHRVAQWAGHSSVKITESFYVHLTGTDLEDMVASLED